jgi:hypothetical protein
VEASSTSGLQGDHPSRTICVLGMHRSGTSCLTGSLQEAGLQLGDCHTWNPFNLKGNRENQAFVDLHDAILEANGGSWDHPPANAQWSERHLAMGRELVAAHSHLPVMGFKDPRTLLVLEGWQQLEPKMEFVGIFRHPNAVAASLARRSKMKRKEALRLWYEYNKRLLNAFRRTPFPVLCFDASEQEFQQHLAGVIKTLELQPAEVGENFYDGDLKNFDHQSSGRLPLKVGYLYKRLKAICV